MPDTEKVITGLEICIVSDIPCKECPYDHECYEGLGKNLMIDALSLLKEVTQRDDELRKKYEALREAYDSARKELKSGCDGCIYKGSDNCPLDMTDERNFICPNGKLNIT